MESASDLYEAYEADYTLLIESISSKLKLEARQVQGEPRRTLLRRIEMELEEADEIIAQMEIEIQTAELSDKAKVQTKVKGFKRDLVRYRAEQKLLNESTDRDDLLSTSASPHLSIQIDDPSDFHSAQASRTRLMTATDKLTDGQRRLEDSHRVALEAEEVGSGILRDLRGQREQLVHTRDNLYEADGSIDRASNTLHKMVRRMYQQRAVTYGIIGVLILLILYVIYAKLFA